MKLTRRNFIKGSLIASATLAPVAWTVARETGLIETNILDLLGGSADEHHEFHVIDKNLLNLHFYFINTRKKNGNLVPADLAQESFMIVRLPQQHVSEAGFWEANWTDAKNNRPFATLSGFSFLAFHLWPQITIGPDTIAKPKKRLPFKLESFLNWNDESNFELITLIDWLKLKQVADKQFDFADVLDCDNFKTKKICDEKLLPKNDVLKRYKAIVTTLFEGNIPKPPVASSSFVPITFFEVPDEVCLVPILRQADAATSERTRKKFWKNQLVPKSSEKNYARKFEVWSNSLFYQPTEVANRDGELSGKKKFVIEAPSFRIAGLITERASGCSSTTTADCSVPTDPNINPKRDDVLPTLLDKTELAYLTQYAKKNLDEDRTSDDFDIKEVNGFLFTGLGVITHLKYENQKHLPPGIDLIEYEHRITQGRDLFVKVARLGYNIKTGQKYKHVIEAKRKIETKESVKGPPLASFLELKQYCECIEDEISYTEFASMDWEKQDFFAISNAVHPVSKPIESNPCHFRRGSYSRLRITDQKRVPIDCLQDEVIFPTVCTLEKLPWFWVIKEGVTGVKDTDVPIERYVQCHYEATDWEGAKIEASTPFMFVRKSYIDELQAERAKPNDPNGAYRNYLKGSYDANPRDRLVERRLTFFNGKKLAFTPAPPKPNAKLFTGEIAPTYDSKTNVLELDYFESYFNIKNTRNANDPDATKSMGEKRYVVFPQVLRARVYLDHIRDIAQKKVASIVEYHSDYIQGGFDERFRDGFRERTNFGKLILQHTEAYKNALEEPVNKTYDSIKTALQQAKDKLGNLAVPDVIPDALSLDKSGITLPPDMSARINQGEATFNDLKNTLEKLSPRALLRGKVSEILGGIDLNAILDELIPQENSPLFELKKLTNELEKIEQAVVSSSTYQEILQTLRVFKQRVDDALAAVNDILRKIEDARLAVNAALHNISEEIPNVDELDSIVKKLFERYRTRAFEAVLEQIKFAEIQREIDKVRGTVEQFLAQELAILKTEFQARLAELDKFFAEVKVELGQLQVAQLDKIEGLDIDVYFRNHLWQLYYLVIHANFDNYPDKIRALLSTVADDVPILVNIAPSGSPVDLKPVYYKFLESSHITADGTTGTRTIITWELTDKPDDAQQLFDLRSGAAYGYVQLKKKVEDFKTLVSANMQSTNVFQQRAIEALLQRLKDYERPFNTIRDQVEGFQKRELEPVSKNIREWRDKAEAFLLNPPNVPNPPKVKDAVKRVQELVLKANAYVDYLRKIDPYFYYQEQERLKKDALDIKRRFFGVLANLFGPLDELHECPSPPPANCTGSQEPFTSITHEVQRYVCAYNCLRTKLLPYAQNPAANMKLLDEYVQNVETLVKLPLSNIRATVIAKIENDPNYQELKAAYAAVQKARNDLASHKKDYEKIYEDYLKLVRAQANEIQQGITGEIQGYIDKLEERLLSEVDQNAIRDLQAKINEARNIYRLLTSIKQQDLTYKWSTSNFHDVNLGILTFKKGYDPDTTLSVDVKITTHFKPEQFPPAIDRIDTYALNRLTNFGVGFFNVLTVGFSEVSFLAQSGQGPHFGVKIKDVQFDGALSFVQEFQKWLAGKGLILRIEADRLVLGYSLPIPAIQTPSFSFFNMSLNFDIRLYFDNRPMRFGFSFARPDLKFGIAAGIYAGFGFFGLVGEPKRGIVEMDAALEAGAWKGINIGPISGEVKLAFGFRYTRNDAGVRLEGYIVAEGRLSVWIIEVAARIYLGVVSENSYVEGRCTVTYSAKLGFVSKSFSGTFHQKIAGSGSKNNSENAQKLVAYHEAVCALFPTLRALSIPSNELVGAYLSLLDGCQAEGEFETRPVSRESWKKFARVM